MAGPTNAPAANVTGEQTVRVAARRRIRTRRARHRAIAAMERDEPQPA